VLASSAPPKDNDAWIGRTLNQAVVGITGGITAITLPVGIPLWAVGSARLTALRPSLALAPVADHGGAGATASLGLRF
jgi:hypothetical protein